MSTFGRNDSIPDVNFLSDAIGNISITDVLEVTEFKKRELDGSLKPEPILNGDKSRFVLFPIQHTDVSK